MKGVLAVEEKKDYLFPIRCENCGRQISLHIPWGTEVKVFTTEYKEKCKYCGCCGWEKGDWRVPSL